jgi:hypothetical protein
MSTQTVIAATTGAVVTQQVVQSDKHPYIFLSADLLAGAEEVDIYYRANNTWVVVADPATGNAVKLTASIPVVRLAGGPLYGVLKDATAGACGVYWEPGTRVY